MNQYASIRKKNNTWFLTTLFVLLFILILQNNEVTAYAGNNGPSTGETATSYVSVKKTETSEYINLYSAKYETKQISGAVYDKKTNTLTLTNFSGFDIECNEMGDDFSIQLVGKNQLHSLKVWGFGYGGSLTLSGTGSLSIVNDTKDYYGVGLLLMAERAPAILTVKKGVTLESFGPYGAILIAETTVSKNAIILEDGVSFVTKGTVKSRKVNALNGATYYNWGFSEAESFTDAKNDTTVKLETKKQSTTTVTKPGKTYCTLASVTGGVKVTVKAIDEADGYRIYMSRNKGAYKILKTKTTENSFSVTKKGLTKGTYSFKVRTYKIVDGTKVWGSTSKVKTIVVK